MTIQAEPASQPGPGVPVAATAVGGPFEPLAIATDRCKGCGLCVSICPKHVLELEVRIVNPLGHHPVRLTDASGCTSCALCARICPDAVFAVYARPKGTSR